MNIPNRIVDGIVGSDMASARLPKAATRVARLVAGEYEELCVARSIGPGGVLLECTLPLHLNQRVWIELNDDTPFWGTVLWHKDGAVGIGFDDLCDLNRQLSHSPGALDRRAASAPRLRVEAKGRIDNRGFSHDIWVHSLSPAGAGITFHPEYDDDLEAGENIVFVLDGFGPREAVIRWYHDGRAGMEFISPMPNEQFMQWIADCFGSGVMRRGFGKLSNSVGGDLPFGSKDLSHILGVCVKH